MKLIKDLGTRFPTANSKSKKRYGLYLCPDCQVEFETQTANVKRGGVKRCNPCGVIATSRKNIKHGDAMGKTRLYGIWLLMRQRCNDEANSHYCGRGISVCKEWDNFSVFKAWSLSNGYNDSLSIDRINNDGNYESKNCRWTTDFIQARNTTLLRADNKTGYRGVCIRGKKFIATIGVNNKTIHLGTFNTASEAGRAYNKYVEENGLEHTRNII